MPTPTPTCRQVPRASCRFHRPATDRGGDRASAAAGTCAAGAPKPRSGLVGEEALAALAAEEACLGHPREQRRRREVGLFELLVERLGDRLGRVEPDEVREGERSERVRAADHHPRVDVLGAREPRLEHPDRREQVRDEQGVDDEPRAVRRGDDALAQSIRREGPHPRRRLGAREQRRDDLHELEDRHRVEEVHPDHLLGPLRRHGELDDRDRRGVRGEDRVLALDDRVEVPKDLLFGALLFEHGLHHQVPIPERLERAREGQVRPCQPRVLLRELARGNRP